MSLGKLFQKKRSEIVESWFNAAMAVYPEDSARLLKKEKDGFANPVGETTRQSLGALFDELLAGMDLEKAKEPLDAVIRIRAVQEISPSSATSFILSLKHILRNISKNETKNSKSRDELLSYESNVDLLCLLAFDVYMACREQIFQFKADHVKDRTLNLLQKADILCEVPDMGTEIIPHHVYKDGGFDKE